MSSVGPHPGFELVWVNASPKGPTQLLRSDAQHYFVMRLPLGKIKTVSRSNAETTYSPVNDLDDTLLFPGAKVVSRNHATFEWQGDRLIVKDLGSTHGTFVAHRHAKFLPTHDQFNEGDPSAVKKRVEGIMELQEGDLIEFGKDCHRTAQSYHPVRCYLRALRQPISLPSTTTTVKKSSAISVSDDLFDSDSDIVSIAADSFTRRKAPPSTASAAETPHEIVDLTSEDEEDSGNESHDTNDGNITFQDQSLNDRHDTYPDVPIFKRGVFVGLGPYSAVSDPVSKSSDAINFEESDSSSDEDIDPFDFSQVPWRNEIHEAAREQAELDREALDARSQGESYLSQYKVAQQPESAEPGLSSYKTAPEQPDSPASSVAADSPVLDASKAGRFNPSEFAAEIIESAVQAAIAPAEVAVPATAAAAATEDSIQIEKVEQLSASPQKRKRDVEDTGDSRDEQVQHISITASTSTSSQQAASSTDDSASSAGSISLLSLSSSSPLPPPSKKGRTEHHAQLDRIHAGRAQKRARKVRAIAAKAVQVTSLLSFGFLAGSLFTFKSMMNAAAAANAAGSGK